MKAQAAYMKDGTEVGSGWVEQMVTPPNPK
ncbi:hypothetical protein MSP8887_02296 [Marinomonas spartinae]|uniref:Uncharacterized protein n=1 Tax=Marinomonas spartinae TaxID=1792290 RepID=A0A1A8TSG7_9GAMM|nr:hypothetical protein MSP8887_02296 [Marinomonas spartinae]SBS36534.1 hypothetical protein MSP8886_03744 [Marinomonas spartinae]